MCVNISCVKSEIKVSNSHYYNPGICLLLN